MSALLLAMQKRPCLEDCIFDRKMAMLEVQYMLQNKTFTSNTIAPFSVLVGPSFFVLVFPPFGSLWRSRRLLLDRICSATLSK